MSELSIKYTNIDASVLITKDPLSLGIFERVKIDMRNAVVKLFLKLHFINVKSEETVKPWVLVNLSARKLSIVDPKSFENLPVSYVREIPSDKIQYFLPFLDEKQLQNLRIRQIYENLFEFEKLEPKKTEAVLNSVQQRPCKHFSDMESTLSLFVQVKTLNAMSFEEKPLEEFKDFVSTWPLQLFHHLSKACIQAMCLEQLQYLWEVMESKNIKAHSKSWIVEEIIAIEWEDFTDEQERIDYFLNIPQDFWKHIPNTFVGRFRKYFQLLSEEQKAALPPHIQVEIEFQKQLSPKPSK